MSNKVKFVRGDDNLEKRAGDKLAEIIDNYRDKSVLFMSSGGSALGILEHVVINSNPSRLTLTVLDERLSNDPSVNNYLQLGGTNFYREMVLAGAGVIGTIPKENESVVALANRFEGTLRQWRAENSGGVVLVTMGIGTDGHIAGIANFSDNHGRFSELFENPNTWVVGYDAGDKMEYPKRVTVTNVFLRNGVDQAVALVRGSEKRVALYELEGGKTVAHTPAAILREMKKVTLYTDIE